MERTFLVTARVDEDHTAKSNLQLPALFEQPVLALPVTLSQQATQTVAQYGGAWLSNSKSHRTQVRWDFPLNVVKEPDTTVLYMGTTGKHLSERPIPSKNLALGDAVAAGVTGAWARHWW